MQFHLITFSGTGNTDAVADKLKENLEKAGSVRRESLEKVDSPGIFQPQGVLGIGYPVYDFLPPDIVLEFLEKIPRLETPVPVFLFNTYASAPLDSNTHAAHLLMRKGYRIIAARSFKAPAPVMYFFGNPEHPAVRKTANWASDITRQIRAFGQNIREAVEPGKTAPEVSLKRAPFRKVFQGFSRLTFGRTFYRNLKVSEDCIGCGICVGSCPEGNLEIREGKLHLHKTNNCLRCLRCHQACPRNAIHFTSAARKGDYSRERAVELMGGTPVK